MLNSKKHFAFTLSEVLIVLAVIGIIATLTIPTLLENSTKKHYNAAYAKIMNTLENNNGILLDDFSSSKLSEICSDDYVSGCLSKTIRLKYNSEYDLHVSNDNIGYRFVSLNYDGTTKNNIYMQKYYSVLVDLNGIKKPNTECVDRYIIWINDNGTVVDPGECSEEYK